MTRPGFRDRLDAAAVIVLATLAAGMPSAVAAVAAAALRAVKRGGRRHG